MITYYIELEGQIVATKDPLLWSEWFSKADRVVKADTIEDATVSTVFLGIDHNFGGLDVDLDKYEKVKALAAGGIGGERENAKRILLEMDKMIKPLLYETMVFGGPHDQEMDRYHTREESLIGHEAIVNLIKRKFLENKDA